MIPTGLLILVLLMTLACDSSERDPTGVPTEVRTLSLVEGPTSTKDLSPTPKASPTEEPTPTEPTIPQTVNPGPAVYPPWQPDYLVARTAGASIAVHKVVISEDLITLLYSIELAHAEPHRTILISPKAQLVGSDPKEPLTPTVEKILYHGIDVSLGALSFEGLSFLGHPVYVMVRPDGNVFEISEEWYRNIDQLLTELE